MGFFASTQLRILLRVLVNENSEDVSPISDTIKVHFKPILVWSGLFANRYKVELDLFYTG